MRTNDANPTGTGQSFAGNRIFKVLINADPSDLHRCASGYPIGDGRAVTHAPVQGPDLLPCGTCSAAVGRCKVGVACAATHRFPTGLRSSVHAQALFLGDHQRRQTGADHDRPLTVDLAERLCSVADAAIDVVFTVGALAFSSWTFIPRGDMHPMHAALLDGLDRCGGIVAPGLLRGGLAVCAKRSGACD